MAPHEQVYERPQTGSRRAPEDGDYAARQPNISARNYGTGSASGTRASPETRRLRRPSQATSVVRAAPARATASPAWGPDAPTAAPETAFPVAAPVITAIRTQPVASAAVPGGAMKSSIR